VGPFDLLARWPDPRPCAAILQRIPGGTEVADSDGDASTVCGWASVTKLLVALSALVEVDRGVLDLAYPTGPPGSTVRHLLSHSSGLAMEGDEVLAAPGQRRIYSNSGIELAARRMEELTGREWREILERNVSAPLGMRSISFPPRRSPAWAARSAFSDLVVLARELLAPTIVSAERFAEAISVVFAGLPGVVPGIGRYENCDWGLGFEIKGSKTPHWTATAGSPRTFCHFGRSGAFIWVDPDAAVACVVGGGAPFGSWAKEEWPRFSDAVLEAFS
jgi:CubicO group peptidase (beta-lactamase class C family)